MSDQAFEDWKQRAREADLLTVAKDLGGARLKRSGNEWVGPCPACNGTDKFSINPQKKKWNCRGITKPEQNAVGLLMHCSGIDFMEACEQIAGPPPKRERDRREPTEQEQQASQEKYERQKEAEKEQAAEESKRASDKMASASEVFASGAEVFGTKTEAYLKARGIALAPEQAIDLRHIQALEYRGRPDPQSDDEANLGSFPAMLAAIRRADGTFLGLHRTYLDPKAPKKLTPPGDTSVNAVKKAWGLVKHGSILLGPVQRCMAIGEGIETAASYFALGLGPDDCGVAAAVSLGNLAGRATESNRYTATDAKGKAIESYSGPNGIPDMHPDAEGMELWPDVEEVIILGDHDWGQGKFADWRVMKKRRITLGFLLTAARRWRAQGKIVSVHMAPEGMDWNDVLTFKGEPVIPELMSFDAFEAWCEPILKPEFHSRFGALTLDQLDEKKEELEFLIEGFFTTGEKSVIGGESRSGKSFLAIHAAMAVALNQAFFGAKVKPGLVIYQAGEGARGIKKRLRAYLRHFGITPQAGAPFVLLKHKIDIYSPQGDTEAFIEECQAHARMLGVPLALIVIDTLATAQGAADENSGKDMGAVMANIDRINERTGAHVCLVHHMNKSNGKLRGHTSLYANVDQVVLVRRDEKTNVRTARLDKQKDDEDGLEFKFELLQVHLGATETGRAITSCVVVDVGAKQRIIEQQLGDASKKGFFLKANEREVFDAMWAALKKQGEQAPSDLGLPLGTRVVNAKHFRSEFRAMTTTNLGEDTQDPVAKKRLEDAIRQRIKTAAQSLRKFGCIDTRRLQVGEEEVGYMWWTGKPIRGLPETYETTVSRSRSRENDDEAMAPVAGGSKPKDDDVLPF